MQLPQPVPVLVGEVLGPAGEGRPGVVDEDVGLAELGRARLPDALRRIRRRNVDRERRHLSGRARRRLARRPPRAARSSAPPSAHPAPSATSRLAVASPMPELAPVTTHARPLMPRSTGRIVADVSRSRSAVAPAVYRLTAICCVRHIMAVTTVFDVLAEPNRRRHPGVAPRRRASRRGPRRCARRQPAGRVQASARAPRGRAGRGPHGCAATRLPGPSRAAARGGRVAGALSPAVGRPGWTPSSSTWRRCETTNPRTGGRVPRGRRHDEHRRGSTTSGDGRPHARRRGGSCCGSRAASPTRRTTVWRGAHRARRTSPPGFRRPSTGIALPAPACASAIATARRRPSTARC